MSLEGHSPSKSTPHPLSIQANAVLASAKGLLEYYNSLAERVASSDGRLTIAQDGDSEFTKLEKLIVNRGNSIDKQAQSRLLEGKGRDGKENIEPLSPSEQTLWKRFGTDVGDVVTREGRKEAIHATEEDWKKAAKHVKKGVQRLVKHLPGEE